MPDTPGADEPIQTPPQADDAGDPAGAAPADDPPPVWTFGEAVRTIGHPAIYRMILFIYIPFLIPIAVAGVLFCRWIDSLIGWSLLPGFPFNVIAWAVLTVLGLIIVWWCYSYLIIVGGGGPAPLVAKGAHRVVIGGPYGISRHPSVWGKLLGVIGLGLLLRSTFFLCVLLPLVLTGSLIEKKFFMEKRDLEHFGPKYAEYIRRVPFFVPRPSGILRTIRVLRGVEQEATVLDDLELDTPT